MKTEVSDAVADAILSGNKVKAIALVRNELKCSLEEAMLAIEEFQGSIGQKQIEAIKRPKQIITDYRLPIKAWFPVLSLGFSIISAIRCMRLAKRHSLELNYELLQSHNLIGGNPLNLVKGMVYADQLEMSLSYLHLAAADITLKSLNEIKDWIDNGCPELNPSDSHSQQSGI